jgi:hypothetical protein
MHHDEISATTAAFDRAIATMRNADAAWQALRELTDRLVGAKLFTVSVIDWANERAGRVFTSHPEAYPVSGTKPIHYDDWFEIVHKQRRAYVANSLAEMSDHFFDRDVIESLGCASVVNLPIEVAGEMVGTVNLLDVEGFYTPERLGRTGLLALPGKTAYLASFYFQRSGD